MFLTRFGFGSKMVITGDITQIDLPGGKNSGLKDAARILGNVPGIGVISSASRMLCATNRGFHHQGL